MDAADLFHVVTLQGLKDLSESSPRPFLRGVRAITSNCFCHAIQRAQNAFCLWLLLKHLEQLPPVARLDASQLLLKYACHD